MKSLSADSGHDCPNITGVRGAGNVVANRGTIYDVNGENGHSLSAWNVSSYGSFWINGRLPGTCKSLRVTYSCGNNHPTDVCDCYYPLCVDPGATGSYDNFDWDDFVYTLTDEEKAEQERVLRGECPCGDEEVAGTYHTDEHPVFVLRCRALPQGCECGYSENSNGTCSCNEPPECPNGSYIKNNDGTCSCDESSNGTCRDTDGSDLNMSGWVAIKRDANGQCQCKPTPIKVNWKEDVSAVNGEIEKTLDFGGKSYCGKLGFYGSAKGKLNNVGHGCTDNKYKYEFNADVSTDVKGKSEFSYKMKRVCSEATDVGLNGLFILR